MPLTDEMSPRVGWLDGGIAQRNSTYAATLIPFIFLNRPPSAVELGFNYWPEQKRMALLICMKNLVNCNQQIMYQTKKGQIKSQLYQTA